MATVLEVMKTIFTADVSPMSAAMKKVGAGSKKAGDDVERSMDGASKSTGGLGKAFTALKVPIASVGASLAAALSVAAAFTKIMDSFAQQDALGKTASRLGLTSEALAELTFVGQRFGMEMDEVADAVKDVTEKVADAARNGGGYAETLNRMGLNAKELIALSPDEQFAKIAGALSGLATQGDRTFAALELGSDALLKITNGGKLTEAQLASLRAEAARLQGDLGDAFQTKQAEALTASMRDMFAALNSIFTQIANSLAPAFIVVTETIKEMAVSMRDNIGAGKGWGSVIVTALKVVGNLIHGVLILWDGMKAGFLAVATVGVDALEAIVESLSVLSARVRGFVDFFKLAMENPALAWELAVAGIKNAFVQFANSVVNNLAMMAERMAPAVAVIDEDLAAALQNAAAVSASSMGKIATESQVAFDRMRKAADKEVPGIGDAVRRAFGTLTADDISSPMIDSIRSSLQSTSSVLTEETSAALQGIRDTALMFGADGVSGFIDNIEAATRERLDALRATVEEERAAADGGGEMDPAEDPRVIYEQAVRDEIGRIDQAQFDEEVRLQAERDRFYKSSLQNKLSVTSSILGNLSTLMQSENEKMFKVGKASALAQAIVDTWAAANKAMASLPYPVNLAAAAATAAAGMMNVQRIASQKFNSGGGGAAAGGGGGGGAAVAGGGEAATDGGGGAAAPVQQTNVNVALHGQMFSGNQVRTLLNSINDQLDDNANIRTNVE